VKAVIQRRYGSIDDLELKEIDKPEPGPDQVLVRVQATSVHADVWHVVTGFPYVLRLMGAGLLRPRNPVPGIDLAGKVEAVGQGVTRFKAGDEVFGEIVGGFQWKNGGTYAEYAVAPADELAPKPGNITFEQAAAAPTPALIALRNLKGAKALEEGRKILINGAGGCLGTLAIQIAKAYGMEVTGVDHTAKLGLLTDLGADHVIDYTREDFTRRSARYDSILDIASTLKLSEAKRALVPDGKYILIGHDHFGKKGRRWLGSLPRAIGQLAITPFVRILPRVDFSLDLKDLLNTLKELLEAGKITPFVDRTFALDEVSQALRYLQDDGRKGNIVLVP
jgi:NADPH:quinone reductase-like Zn-dependent oxidoreductase